MTDKNHILSKPPILEAQIVFSFKTAVDISNINDFHSAVKDKYPQLAQRFNVSHTLGLGGKQSSEAVKQELVGYQLLSADGKKTLFYQKANLVFSELGQYHSWDKFLDEIFETGNKIKGSLANSPFGQVSARYINQFNITPPFDPAKLFNILPKVELSSHKGFMNSSFVKFNLASNNGMQAAVSFFQKGPGTNSSGQIEFILDISVFKDITGTLDNSDQIRADLALLREFKNDVFFNLVTDELLKNYR